MKYTRIITLFFLSFTLSVSVLAQPDYPIQDAAQVFEKNWREGRKLPGIRDLVSDITDEQAYELQRNWVLNSMKTEEIGGVKAGVVTPGSQETFGIKTPISGVLRVKGRIDASPRATLNLADYPELALETEIGFVIGKRLEKAPASLADFKAYVSRITPVIELAAGTWDKPEGDPHPADYIAINLLATGYIVGEGINPDELDPRDIAISFSYQGEELHTARGSDNWKGPWETAFWMTQFAERQGIVLEPGMIIICGALGKVHPGKVGKYVLDAGSLGKIKMKIK